MPTTTTAAAACCSVCSYLSLLSAVAIAHLNSNTHAYIRRHRDSNSQTLTPASQAIISKQLHSKMHSVVCASVKPYTLAHPIHMTVLHNHFE